MNTGVIIAIVLVLTIIVVGGLWWYLTSGSSAATSGTTTPISSSTVGTAASTDPIYLGCYQDSTDRILPKSYPNQTSVAACIALAKAGGYKYAGLQYGGECWAGNNIPTSTKLDNTVCQTACDGGNGGNKSGYGSGGGCGGTWASSVYQI